MKNTIYTLAAIAALFTVACGNEQSTPTGMRYRIIEDKKEGKSVNGDSTMVLHLNYRLALASNDSVLQETFTKGTPAYIGVLEQNFRPMFEKLGAGDSAEALINADTFFLHSFGEPRPSFIREGEDIRFTVKVIDVFSQMEMNKKQEDEINAFKTKDSVAFLQLKASMPSATTTASGMFYIKEKTGKGKQVKKGNKATVLYKGYLLNGQVFDENQTDGITIPVGLGQVIPGWDEMLQLMKEGDKVKVVIPWKLAYGPRGNQGIPPFSSLVFEMELLKTE